MHREGFLLSLPHFNLTLPHLHRTQLFTSFIYFFYNIIFICAWTYQHCSFAVGFIRLIVPARTVELLATRVFYVKWENNLKDLSNWLLQFYSIWSHQLAGNGVGGRFCSTSRWTMLNAQKYDIVYKIRYMFDFTHVAFECALLFHLLHLLIRRNRVFFSEGISSITRVVVQGHNGSSVFQAWSVFSIPIFLFYSVIGNIFIYFTILMLK